MTESAAANAYMQLLGVKLLGQGGGGGYPKRRRVARRKAAPKKKKKAKMTAYKRYKRDLAKAKRLGADHPFSVAFADRQVARGYVHGPAREGAAAFGG